MTLRRGEDGRLYGTIEVLLIREVNGETETLIGTQSPFGYITVRAFDGKRFVEKPESFWEGHGFTITAPPILDEARRLGRVAREAQS